MAQSLTPQLVEQSPDAVIVFVTNPVDVVTCAAVNTVQAEPGRIFGSGTVLDSSRFRYLIARRAAVAAAGAERVLEVPLSQQELQGLRTSAHTLKDAQKSLGI